jgi:hypothetical protein
LGQHLGRGVFQAVEDGGEVGGEHAVVFGEGFGPDWLGVGDACFFCWLVWSVFLGFDWIAEWRTVRE